MCTTAGTPAQRAAIRPVMPAFEEWFVRRQKQQRRIEVVSPTFLSLPGLLVGTRRIATMHRRLAEQVVRTFPLVMRELPFAMPPIREAVQWHISNTNDASLRWVVERLMTVAARSAPKLDNVVPLGQLDEGHRDQLAVHFMADSKTR